MKSELKEHFQEDLDKIRGALKEVIDHNREINRNLMESLEEGDFSLLEEYSIITKGIIDSAKLLSDIHSQAPKTVADQSKIQEEKKKIDLDSLVGE